MYNEEDWMKAVVLLSGGMDSTVCATMAIAQHGPKAVGAVSFIYGQKHTAEIKHAERVAEDLGLGFHRIIELPEIFGGTESVLIEINKRAMPQASYEEMEESYGVSPTYVPYRNANLISMAVTAAMVQGASEVWAGMHGEDALNWAYPDCTPEFLGAMGAAIYVGSYHQVRLITPLQWDTKAQVLRKGLNLEAPLHLTMSCYEGKDPACGTCPTCVGRINAFRELGEQDPINYEIEVAW